MMDREAMAAGRELDERGGYGSDAAGDRRGAMCRVGRRGRCGGCWRLHSAIQPPRQPILNLLIEKAGLRETYLDEQCADLSDRCRMPRR
jgi:hypothetical protein